MSPSTSGSPPHAAHGQARRRNCKLKYDSMPSFQTIASSSPICWMFVGSKRMISILARSHMEGHALLCPKNLGRHGDHPSKLIAAGPASFTKNGGANSDKCRSFFDGHVEIIRHTHGKMREFHLKFSFKPVAQFPKIDKVFTRRFRLLRQRRDCH